MKRTPIALLLLTLAFGANAQDIEAGKKKATEVCAACHGPDGNSATADCPKLAGQHHDYLAKSLRAYTSGARKDPVMNGFAAPLPAHDNAHPTA